MATLDDVKRIAKDLALLQHKNDSDDQLRETVKRNGARILSNYGLSDAALAEKARLSGENEGCIELLNRREKVSSELEKKIKAWNDSLPKRKAKAILNLPNAVSANGQLVAAILEEVRTGLTARQLADWCEELSSIPDESFSALLDGLEKEEIIKKDSDGNYRLLSVLDEDMLVSYTFVTDRFLEGEAEGLEGKMIIYSLLRSSGKPICAKDVLQFALMKKEDDLLTWFKVESALLEFCSDGLAVKAFKVQTGTSAFDEDDYYALRLLGEEKTI